jgi:tetratricopeptide (TPR) repeat protein
MMVVAVVGLAACGGDEAAEGDRVRLDQPQQSQQGSRADWPDGLAERVDAANAAYGEGRYEAAAEMYREMTAEHPDIGTLWFGLYLSETALGNEEAAEEALVKVQEMVPALLQMQHQGSGMGMPQDSIHQGMMAPPMDSIHAPMMEGGG